MNMKKIVVLLLLLVPIVSKTQERFNHQFDLEFPFHVITSVLPTDSCYYATGVITDTTDASYRIGNIFLKLNLYGEILFEKTLLSDSIWYETWRGDLISDGDGNFLDVGYKSDTVMSAFLVKYNENGDTIFTKTYLNPYFPEDDFIVPASLKNNKSGGYYLLCGINSDPNGSNSDNFLLSLDKDGNMLKSNLFGGQSAEIPYSLVVDEDNGVILGSVITNSSQAWQNFFSRTHIFKTDSLGNVVWEYKSPPGQLFDIARDMVKAPDGGLVVASGKGIEHVVNAETGQLRWNGYMFKLNVDHQLEWGTELRGVRHSASTGLTKVVAAADGSGFVAAGRLIEDKSIGEPLFGSWVVKVSPEGDSLWARYYSVFDSLVVKPQPYDLKNTPDGGYVLVGDNSPELPGITVQRAWIMKLDEHGCLIPGCEAEDTVSTTIVQPIDAPVQLAIYPNPTTDYLNFQLRTARPVQEATFRIMDAQGRVLREFQSSHLQDTFIVPVGGWVAGVYFLQYLEKGALIASEKFVKQ